MRAFDELCVSQGIDPRDLEEAFVSDNLALTAQNELLRQEVDSLRAALAGRREASSTALAVHRIPEQGKAENEDLDHVLSEALDFVSTKTGYAMNLVKKKVARILQPVSDFVEHSTSRSEEVERLKEDLASAKEAVEILSQERNGLIVREVERERMMHGLVGRLESCTDRFEAIKPSLPETSGSSSRKRHRGGKEEEILSLSKAGGQGASGSKRQKGKEWRGGSISPIQQAEDETQAILEMPNCDDIGCIGLSLLHDRGAGRITVGRIIKGGTVDRCKIAISLGDFVVAVDSIKLTTGAEADTVQAWLEGKCGSWVRLEVESRQAGTTSSWDIVRGTPEYLSMVLDGQSTRPIDRTPPETKHATNHVLNEGMEVESAPPKKGPVDPRMYVMCARLIKKLADETRGRHEVMSVMLEKEAKRGKRVERDNARLKREVDRLKEEQQRQQQPKDLVAAPSPVPPPSNVAPQAPAAPISVHVHIHGLAGGAAVSDSAPAAPSELRIEPPTRPTPPPVQHVLSPPPVQHVLSPPPPNAGAVAPPLPPPMHATPVKGGPAPSAATSGGGMPDIAQALRSSPMFNRMKQRVEA